ncbi:hypothetical protein Oter_4422 [Opitutus terrae PB90-1]|uniref:Uncharacterized protein n=1 Tax=Opitutus terrae (strain DSM 11246 / JCM 15787 / PB90-1) TaxID=452637 RepID=B1ZPX2_OPITP|nr:hypothetical protein Oter_4422 [Opitutus terrae PB90-1]
MGSGGPERRVIGFPLNGAPARFPHAFPEKHQCRSCCANRTADGAPGLRGSGRGTKGCVSGNDRPECEYNFRAAFGREQSRGAESDRRMTDRQDETPSYNFNALRHECTSLCEEDDRTEVASGPRARFDHGARLRRPQFPVLERARVDKVPKRSSCRAGRFAGNGVSGLQNESSSGQRQRLGRTCVQPTATERAEVGSPPYVRTLRRRDHRDEGKDDGRDVAGLRNVRQGRGAVRGRATPRQNCLTVAHPPHQPSTP